MLGPRSAWDVGATNVSKPRTPTGGWPQAVGVAAGAASWEEWFGATAEQLSGNELVVSIVTDCLLCE